MTKLIRENPLGDTEAILSEKFYGQPVESGEADGNGDAVAPRPPKPTHYKVICISLYNEDIERLETLVSELKALGHTKASKSAVIRYALGMVDPKKVAGVR